MADFMDEEEYVEMVTLTFEDGTEEDYQVYEKVEYNGEIYGILIADNTPEDAEEIDTVIAKFEDDETLEIVEDDDTIEAVFEVFGKMHEEDYDIEVTYED